MKNKFKSKLKLFLFSKKSLLVSLFLVLTIAFSFAGVSNFLSLADSAQEKAEYSNLRLKSVE